jgi:hypothetical protein
MEIKSEIVLYESNLLTPLFSLWGKKFEIKVNNPCRVFSASGKVFSASGRVF